MARKSNRMSKKKPARAAAHSSSTNGTKTAAAKWVGQPIRRKEESRLVRGRGIFVDDEKMPGMLHIRFIRSSYSHRLEEHTFELQSRGHLVCCLMLDKQIILENACHET